MSNSTGPAVNGFKNGFIRGLDMFQVFLLSVSNLLFLVREQGKIRYNFYVLNFIGSFSGLTAGTSCREIQVVDVIASKFQSHCSVGVRPKHVLAFFTCFSSVAVAS